MSETRVRAPEVGVVDLEFINALRWMTDYVLRRAGVDPQGEQLAPVTKFKITHPDRRYDLLLFSIAEGRWGFNTTSLEGEDNSRRWSVHINTGSSFGAGFNERGTIYEHGGFVDRRFMPRREDIDTGSTFDLIYDFYDNPNGTVSYQPLPSLDDHTIQDPWPSDPVLLHPMPS